MADADSQRTNDGFVHRNALSLACFGVFAVLLIAQSLTGWRSSVADAVQHGGATFSYWKAATFSYWKYVTTGHFAEATFENWESEFLQMAAWQFVRTSEFWFQSFRNWQSEFLAVGSIVVLSVFLRQRGSAESKPVHEPTPETGD